VLPIGTKLDILDDSISFEEQISKLDQPLSNDANLLSHAVTRTPAPQPEQEQDAPRFTGTPVTYAGSKVPMPIKRGDTFHSVVEHHIRAAYQNPDSYPTDFEYINNPIENLNAALEKAWDEPDVRRQALEALCGNETFTQAFLRQLRLRGREQTAVQAAQEQLSDIEAERLEMLMRLETLKSSEKTAREAFLATLSRKKQDELARLDERIRATKAEAERLNGALAALGDEAQARTIETLAQQGAKLFASDGETVALAPTFGEKRTPEEMVDAVRAALGRAGFDCNEDEATELLLYFALFDEFILYGKTLFAAEQCAHALLEGLGLMGVAAFTRGDTCLTVASLLTENGQRTPTVEVCASNRAAVYAYGHKTIRLADRESAAMAPLPLALVPELKAGASEKNGVTPNRPVSLESLTALRPDTPTLLPEGEKWLTGLEQALQEQSASLMPEADLQMRVFIAAASQRLHGGFLAAADAAVLGWVAPTASTPDPEALRPSLESLPRSLMALGII
ncbi:MAG: hypothetical protein PHY64_03345, partial [Eubacteriales bacterium]|nr:hypothetical protein [Eubacteriales bacterium]